MNAGTESVSILYKSNNPQAMVDPQFHRSSISSIIYVMLTMIIIGNVSNNERCL